MPSLGFWVAIYGSYGTSRVVLRAKTRVWGPRLELGIKLGSGPDQLGLGLGPNQIGLGLGPSPMRLG